MSARFLLEALTTLAAVALVVAMVAVFAAGFHWSWVVKERLLARLAARMRVPYVVRMPWHVRAWRWWVR